MTRTRTPATVLPPGTIVQLQARGGDRIQGPARILEASTSTDKLGRRLIRYRVQILDSGLTREWPGPHCKVISPAPASA